MKKTLQIARLELKLLFYSPIAWLMLVTLAVQMAMAFIPLIQIASSMNLQLQLHPIYRRYIMSLTNGISLASGSLLNNMVGYLYIYMPLITMGVMSRELGGRRTIHLLYSSPVNIRQIVFGKYLALLAFIASMMLLFLAAVVFAAVGIIHFDYWHVLVGLAGIFMTLAAYAAIGLFLSSLTTYQVIAAILTFVMLTFLSFVGSFWQDVDFLRDITYYGLWMGYRTSNMLNGLLTTRDVIYFIAIVGMFLAMTAAGLKMSREARPFARRAGRFLVIICCGVIVTYLTSRPGYIGYWDATAVKQNTISENVQHILREMGDAPVEVTEYINFFDLSTYQKAVPSLRNQDKDRWEPFIRFNPNIRLNWVYYYDSITPTPTTVIYKDNPGKNLAQLFAAEIKGGWKINPKDFKTPEEIHRMIDLREERDRVVMQVKYKGKTTWLRTFEDPQMWPSEAEIGAAFKRLLHGPARVAFVNDGYERSIDKIGDRDYKVLTNLKTFRLSLISQGFENDTISLKTTDIPSNLDALVIADPRVALDTASLRKIRQYIDAGGNLFIAGEPGKQAINNALLQYLGVQLTAGQLLQESKDYSPELVTPYITPAAARLSLSLQYDREDSVPVAMKGVSALSFREDAGFTVETALQTDKKVAWNKQGTFTRDSAAVVFDPAQGDHKDTFPTALFLTRRVSNKEQRIFIAGDADFLSNAELGRGDMKVNNFLFSNKILGWLVNGKYPIEATHPRSKDVALRDSIAAIAPVAAEVIFYGIIPGLLTLAGLVIVIRRRRA